MLKQSFEFVVNSECKYEYNYQRQNVGEIKSHPIFNLKSLAGVGFFHIVFPSPALFADTEKKIYKTAERKEDIAYQKVFQIHYRSAEDFEAVPSPNIKA